MECVLVSVLVASSTSTKRLIETHQCLETSSRPNIQLKDFCRTTFGNVGDFALGKGGDLYEPAWQVQITTLTQ